MIANKRNVLKLSKTEKKKKKKKKISSSTGQQRMVEKAGEPNEHAAGLIARII